MSADFLDTASLAAAGSVKEWARRYGDPVSRKIQPGGAFLPDGYGGCGIIAEVKMRSPSRGDLMGETDPERLVELYEAAGAEAVSVVVEERHFGGSPILFETMRKRTDLPMLWKDFVVDPYQIHLAAALGASAVLLIVGLVPDDEIYSFIQIAKELDMTPLVEIHREEELERAISAGADIVGVNNRNLVSLEVETLTSQRMASLFPADLRTVAESGMKSPGDVRRMAGLGYRAVLVGEALVTAEDPAALLKEMVEAGKKIRVSE
jgi:indole-3-glycerol phosphate synthase